MRNVVVAVLTFTVLLSVFGVFTVSAHAPTPNECAATDTGSPTTSGTIGYVDGTWYTDEPDEADNLTESNIDEAYSLGLARTESIRCLTFDEVPEMEVWSESEVRDAFNESDEHDQFTNSVYNAILIDDSSNSVTQQTVSKTQSATRNAFYYAEEDIIVIVGQDGDITANEPDIATAGTQALLHQHFDSPNYEQKTLNEQMAANAIWEGDPLYVGGSYEIQCEEGDWNCYYGEGIGFGTGSSGIEALGQFADGEGVPFIYDAHSGDYDSSGGHDVENHPDDWDWEPIDDIHENRLHHSSHIIQGYGDEYTEPTEVDLDDNSESNWEIVESNNGNTYEVVGEGGIAAMMIHPNIHDENTLVDTPVPDSSWDEDEQLNPTNYNSRYSSGWDGDRLHTYTNDESQDAYVWKIEWESEEDQESFVDGYDQLMEYWEGNEITDNVYHISAGKDYDGTYQVIQDSHTTTIVHAPTPSGLDSVHESAGLDSVEFEIPEDDEEEQDEDISADIPSGSFFAVFITLIAVGGLVYAAYRFFDPDMDKFAEMSEYIDTNENDDSEDDDDSEGLRKM